MPSQYQQIIVPVDGSGSANRAARFAQEIGAALGVPVTHLHVFAVAPGELVGMARMREDDVESARRASAKRAFEAARDATGNRDAAERLVFGEPVDEILTYAAAHGPALIVMGRRGQNAMKRLLVGSVADGVLRRSPTPVTLVS